MRKRISSQPQRESPSANTGWLDLEALARVEVTSEDPAHPIDVVRQQYHFSPSGATEEIEEFRVELEDVAALELTIIPHLSGGSYASLAQLRLAGSGE
jgi:hypothetical protein